MIRLQRRRQRPTPDAMRVIRASILLLAVIASPALGQPVAAAARQPISWTDLSDLVLDSPVILRATVEKAGRLGRRLAPDVPEGEVRALVEARLVGVLKADGMVPGRAEWLWQGAKADAPAKGADVLFFGTVSAGGPDAAVGQYQLRTARAQLPWTTAAEDQVRAILGEARAPGGVPRFRAVRGGFHVPGAVAGESESQFFLDIGRPVTLVVLRRADAVPEVKLATGDIIDESAAKVKPQTLLWRTLACDAPDRLPEAAGSDPALVADWAAAKASWGPCGRTEG